MNDEADFQVGGDNGIKAKAAKEAPAFNVDMNDVKLYGQTASDAAQSATASSAQKSPQATALEEDNDSLRRQVEELTNSLAEAAKEASASDPPLFLKLDIISNPNKLIAFLCSFI